MNVLDIPHLFLVQLFFNGGSQNDLNITGTYVTTNITDFKIVIDSVGTPDTFKWSSDNGSTYFVGNSVSLSGSPVVLGAYGLSIYFGNTTGHTLNDTWSFTARNETKFNVQNDNNTIICNLELDSVLKIGDTISL